MKYNTKITSETTKRSTEHKKGKLKLHWVTVKTETKQGVLKQRCTNPHDCIELFLDSNQTF